MGPIVHSSKLRQGDKVWWPTTNGKLEVQKIQRHNVTEKWSRCCGEEVVEPYCEVLYCCGVNCCCH